MKRRRRHYQQFQLKDDSFLPKSSPHFSYVSMFSMRLKVQTLVSNYFKFNLLNTRDNKDNNFEQNLISIVVEYLLVTEFFKYCTEHINIDDNKMLITKTAKEHGFATCYGSSKIACSSNSIHHWRFRVIKGEAIGVGIIEGNEEKTDCCSKYYMSMYSLHDHKIRYGMWSDGDKTASGHNIPRVNGWQHVGYKTGEIIEMMLNLKTKTLSLLRDNETICKFANIFINVNISYFMAVCLSKQYDCVELIDYFKSKG